MKWAFSSMGLVAAGLVGIVIIILFQNITVNNEQDYYLLKETAEAAMYDAVDMAYYRNTGEVKIIQEKFVENFVRRFADTANVLTTSDYSIEFYDIMEKPPKVSILIKTGLGNYTIYGDADNYNISNQLDAILEADDTKLKTEYHKNCKRQLNTYYLLKGYSSGRNGAINLRPPTDYSIESVNYVRPVLTLEDVVKAGGNKNFEIGNLASVGDVVLSMNVNNNTVSYSARNVSCQNTSRDCYYGFVYDVTWKHKSCG